MKNLFTILIGGWCMLLSTKAPAQNNSLSFSFSNYYFLTPSLIDNFADWLYPDQCNTAKDDDNDGICNQEDCAPSNPNIPGKPGTLCNDNNEFTKNDIIQPDGCTCLGTTTLKDTPIAIDLGPDLYIGVDDTVMINTSVLQFNTCIETSCKENTPLIVHWKMDNFKEKTFNQKTSDYSANEHVTTNKDFCANIVTKGPYLNSSESMTTEPYASNSANKAVVADMPAVSEFKNDHAKAIRFDVILDPTADISRISKLTFMQRAPKQTTNSNGRKINNNYPTNYGIRITKAGEQIYKIISLNTSERWREATFDFSNEPFFEVSSTTLFTFELLAYNPVLPASNNQVSHWSIDDLRIYGNCCNTTSFQSSRYLWSTGERQSKIAVNKAGDYSVTVTDCNGTTAVDQVVVNWKKGGMSTDKKEEAEAEGN